MKTTGQYFNFNFDDIPEYIPLEHTLILLRSNPYDVIALEKLLQVLN